MSPLDHSIAPNFLSSGLLDIHLYRLKEAMMIIVVSDYFRCFSFLIISTCVCVCVCVCGWVGGWVCMWASLVRLNVKID